MNPDLPIGRVLVAATATQSLTTMGVMALAAVAPRAALDLGVSPALIGYQVGVIYLGAVLSALGALPMLAAGGLVMGLGYGLTGPAGSHLLSRAPIARNMNLIFSIKQCGVPIGGILAGLVVPPITVALGWQAALVGCAMAMLALSLAIQGWRSGWDRDCDPSSPYLASPLASLELVWRHGILRWLALSSLLYSAVQLCLSGFLVTYLVAEAGMELVLAGSLLAMTHAAGAIGRLAWGWIADRLRSGTLALITIGMLTIFGALATAAIDTGWPVWLIAAAVTLFGVSAMGWNGVFIAVIARQAPHSIGVATGGALAFTFSGVVVGPAAFAAIHDHGGLGYGAAYALLGLVAAAGIACLVQARRNIGKIAG